jgi:hypothetical protein
MNFSVVDNGTPGRKDRIRNMGYRREQDSTVSP